MTSLTSLSLDAGTLARGYRARRFTPSDIVREIHRRIAAHGDDKVWLHLAPLDEVLARAARVEAAGPDGLALYGLPYGVKDSIDVAGWPTTAGCTARHDVPTRSAAVVERLDAAGAINLGKQNLDQFATGLVGVRTTTGHPRNAVDPRYVPGGSSSGSAVAVAAGFTTFSIGTDTGGSGRVPGAYNNVVGLKPTPGRVSTRGLVYNNRTFDVPPVFALTVPDAHDVLRVIEGADPEDSFSVPAAPTAPLGAPGAFRFAVPHVSQQEFFGDAVHERQFEAALVHLQALGGSPVAVDFSPFLEAGRLVFDGPFIAERWITYGALIERHPEAVHPAVRDAVANGRRYDAADTFRALYRLSELQGEVGRLLAGVDALVTPTVGTLYTTHQVEEEPVLFNTRMGHYTYFANPLRLAAISVPAGLREDGLPFGLCLSGLPFTEARLGAIAHALQQRIDGPLGASSHRPSTVSAA